MDLSDSSSMSTLSKARMNGLTDQKQDNMIHVLRADIQGYVYNDVTLEHFVEYIWGVPPEKITKLLAADWTLDETALAQYENVLDLSNILKETDLHAPFQAIASKLVLDAHIVLGMSGVDLAEHFWDGKGTAILSSQYTK